MQLIECIPNFSEGRDLVIIKAITDEIESVENVKLLDVDPGKATNRTVVTFVGEPNAVVKAAFLAIKKAGELIDMTKQSGEHPRMGATDVCPFVPVSGISMEETAQFAHQLGKRVGEELGIPCYMYESAATDPKRKNLATIRAGEYEGFASKIVQPEWKPDYGAAQFNAFSGATVIGARDFLIAYNINLNTTSTRRANAIAYDIREKGRVMREGKSLLSKVITDENGKKMRQKGTCKGVKAIASFKQNATLIFDLKADYLLALKKNNKHLFLEVESFFTNFEDTSLIVDVFQNENKGHGRIEKRKCRIISDLRFFPDLKDWKGIQSLICIESQRTLNGKTSNEKRYYISSLKPNAKILASAIRKHWTVENELHWSLDVAFNEDRCRIKHKQAAANFAAIRRFALALLKNAKLSKLGIKNQRLQAAWSNDFLEKIFTFFLALNQ